MHFNASDEEFSQLNPKCDTDTVLCMYNTYRIVPPPRDMICSTDDR